MKIKIEVHIRPGKKMVVINTLAKDPQFAGLFRQSTELVYIVM